MASKVNLRPTDMDTDQFAVSDSSQPFSTPSDLSGRSSNTTPETLSSSPPRDYISVSTAFHPQMHLPAPNNYAPDTIVYSSPDSVFFHVHRRQLDHPGATLLHQVADPTNPVIMLNDPSDAVNCVLHILYGFSSRNYSPAVENFAAAFAILTRHGYSLSSLVTPQSEVFNDLLLLSDSKPLQIYTLAASHSLDSLAVQASTPALSVPLTEIDNNSAIAMGPVYLLRLATLHQQRKDALKALMLVAPKEHADVPDCGPEDRRSVMRAYALAAAYLAWEVVPNADRDWILRGLSPLLGHVSCQLCEKNLRARIQAVLDSWEQVTATI